MSHPLTMGMPGNYDQKNGKPYNVLEPESDHHTRIIISSSWLSKNELTVFNWKLFHDQDLKGHGFIRADTELENGGCRAVLNS